jgi:hypothetical protein
VVSIGPVSIPDPLAITFNQVRAIPDESPLHCVIPSVEADMVRAIDAAKRDIASGAPPWQYAVDRRLTGAHRRSCLW